MPIYELRYRERLDIVPRDGTQYSKLTDEALRSECAAIHDAMSAFRQSWLADMDALSKSKPSEFRDAFSSTERKHRATFDEKFLGKYRNLHAELLSRQPKLEASGVDLRPAHLLMESGSLAGPDPIGALITHLDQLIDRMAR